MKTFSKFCSVIMLGAFATVLSAVLSADEAVIKPLRYQPVAKSQFVEKAIAASTTACPACKNDLVPTVTQDTKLRTKTVLVAVHGCKECSTAVVRTGAQKATGKDMKRHTCGAMIAAVETCCGRMK